MPACNLTMIFDRSVHTDRLGILCMHLMHLTAVVGNLVISVMLIGKIISDNE